MITYSFVFKNIQNFTSIISTVESAFSTLMHTVNPLPTSLTYINGSLGLSGSPSGNMLYIQFFESTDNYQVKDSSGTVIYQSQALATIPTQTQVQDAIGDLL